ncbi:helix-turn-helix domain-containing protein [Homoserinibacter sp. YIM 151385]|uniref:helix-turn-helix domain-containing protein n=1 Tax=Homoserinibacter sp. YIM 151385 TaxID=2985506 RepID=UPI0022F02A77|nr:helix-turn-helix transcriptional regulator [Homoserinibacter sp. YIM 151385]WBU38097.1 helix-turn-helix transcriptional regulator [Homoserinibacter sp. YIM 151385]
MSNPRRELGEFLRSARARRDPDQSGLFPDGRVRRVAGLRREEVALLAGVSTDYYTRLEQGRDITPSPQVLNALVRALDLDEAGQAYLRTLADSAPASHSRPVVQRVRPGVHRLLDTFRTQPALILGRRTDVLASNRLARALFTDFEAMPAKDRNYARWMLLDAQARRVFADWEDQARNAVEALRLDAAGNAADAGLQRLVGELTLESPEFRHWWSAHRVHQRTHGTKHLNHPVVGELSVEFETFTLPGDPSQVLYLYTTEPGSDSDERLSLLASWTRNVADMDDKRDVDA